MANSNGWGDGAANNTIGWGKGKVNNAIGWGSVYSSSNAGRTDIIGATGTAPTNINPPAIPTINYYYVGYTISFTGNVWSGNPVPTLTYQWQRDGINILGATSITYEATDYDGGYYVGVKCTATNSQGTAFVLSNTVFIETD